MHRPPTLEERQVLLSMVGTKRPGALRLAQRAYCVLEPHLSSRDVVSTGLSEERVFEIRDAFDTMGMVGLVDAPRSGRPAKLGPTAHQNSTNSPSGDRASPAEEILQRDAKWRQARRSGRSLERSRMASAFVREVGQGYRTLVGLWLAADFRAAALTSRDPATITHGVWYHPSANALKEAARAQGADQVYRIVELGNAIYGHLQHAHPATTRGERDKLEFWVDSLQAIAARERCVLLIDCPAESRALHQFLSLLRKHELWSGPKAKLEKLEFQEEHAWSQIIKKTMRTDITGRLSTGGSAFAWFHRRRAVREALS